MQVAYIQVNTVFDLVEGTQETKSIQHFFFTTSRNFSNSSAIPNNYVQNTFYEAQS
jgi:hypothetical protein